MFRITRRTAENKVDRRTSIFCHDYKYIEKGDKTYFQTRTLCDRKGRLDNEDTHLAPAFFTAPAEQYLVEPFE